MELFPAIDMLNGRAVRLYKGRKDQVTDYGSILERAKLWQSQGAKFLHMVDLDGAFSGTITNHKFIAEVAAETGLKIQVGGGIRSLKTCEEYLCRGAQRVIFGTIAVKNRKIVEEALKEFGKDRVVLGVDTENSLVKVSGWVEDTKLKGIDFINSFDVDTVVFTDISRDGALSGINISETEKVQQQTGKKIIASGGLSDLGEIKEMKERNFYGVILGKAIYENKFTVKEALEVK